MNKYYVAAPIAIEDNKIVLKDTLFLHGFDSLRNAKDFMLWHRVATLHEGLYVPLNSFVANFETAAADISKHVGGWYSKSIYLFNTDYLKNPEKVLELLNKRYLVQRKELSR